MNKGQNVRKQQREFLFVFESNSARIESSVLSIEDNRAASGGGVDITSDEAKEARRKLIAELHELGC
ncbi:hypothetical protein ACFPOD_04205 [Nitratireductor kimnyeongensis]|uniref:Uncharacterized protein n=1 Tax=Nitratireductor kimnyeongensis TaxID=430679 RepID=A0ABW0T5Q1_9HYPH|nr:hypothetical protein [Nitratireductor kimnyeongensis]QZZ34703.1 hypothetical protein KW403_12990 [Nitratireductor kimnyeongensis]